MRGVIGQANRTLEKAWRVQEKRHVKGHVPIPKFLTQRLKFRPDPEPVIPGHNNHHFICETMLRQGVKKLAEQIVEQSGHDIKLLLVRPAFLPWFCQPWIVADCCGDHYQRLSPVILSVGDGCQSSHKGLTFLVRDRRVGTIVEGSWITGG